MMFMKKVKHIPLSGIALMSKGVLTKTTVAVFPTGSKKRKSNNNGKHAHGQEKRRLSTS